MTESQLMEGQTVWRAEAIEALEARGFQRLGMNESYLSYRLRKGPVVVSIVGLSGWHIRDRLDGYWVLGNRLPELLAQLRNMGVIEQ